MTFSKLLGDRGEAVKSVQPEVSRDMFPWAAYLPEEDRRQFSDELVKAVRASSAVDRADLIASLIAQWKHTAEVWADPGLRARLASEPELAGGEIPRPA